MVDRPGWAPDDVDLIGKRQPGGLVRMRMRSRGVARLPMWRPEDGPAEAEGCPAFVGVGLRD